MTIIKIYNQINKQPFEDVQAEVERLMKEPPHMFQSPRRSHAYRWTRLSVVDPNPPQRRHLPLISDTTCTRALFGTFYHLTTFYHYNLTVVIN